MPRHRTARTAVLGVTVRRPATGKPPSRTTSALLRRVVVGILVLLAVGVIFFHIQVLGSWAAFAGVALFGMITFLAIGAAIGSVAGSFRTANIIIWTIFVPMLMLSELFMPVSILPGWLQPVAEALPLTPVNTMLRDIVYGVPLEDLWRLGVMAAWLVVATIVTVRFFRWE